MSAGMSCLVCSFGALSLPIHFQTISYICHSDRRRGDVTAAFFGSAPLQKLNLAWKIIHRHELFRAQSIGGFRHH